jgi:hypothetical protein
MSDVLRDREGFEITDWDARTNMIYTQEGIEGLPPERRTGAKGFRSNICFYGDPTAHAVYFSAWLPAEQRIEPRRYSLWWRIQKVWYRLSLYEPFWTTLIILLGLSTTVLNGWITFFEPRPFTLHEALKFAAIGFVLVTALTSLMCWRLTFLTKHWREMEHR